jgi:hypothetical protein
MPLILWLIPGGLFIWLLSQMKKEEPRQRPQEVMPWDRPRRPHFQPPLTPPRRSIPIGPARVLSSADHLEHLHECLRIADSLEHCKPYALAGDVDAVAHTCPREVLEALCRPIDMVLLQKDLNVLGSEPPVPEDGRRGRDTVDAIRAFQASCGLPATGEVDLETVAAVRYATGCIYGQMRG